MTIYCHHRPIHNILLVACHMSNTTKNFISRTMDERELPSDSDESDGDYVPSGKYKVIVITN